MTDTGEAALIGSELSTAQHRGLMVAGGVSCSLSVIFSTRLLLMAWKRKEPDNAYYRIMIGLSLADILASIGIFSQPFLIVADVVSWSWAFGNVASCSFAGFMLTNFMLTVANYNCFLSLTFLLMVRFNWKPVAISGGKFEWMGHGVVWIVPLLMRIPAVATGSINPKPITRLCVAYPSPVGCSVEDGTCERGENYRIFSEYSLIGTACCAYNKRTHPRPVSPQINSIS